MIAESLLGKQSLANNSHIVYNWNLIYIIEILTDCSRLPEHNTENSKKLT